MNQNTPVAKTAFLVKVNFTWENNYSNVLQASLLNLVIDHFYDCEELIIKIENEQNLNVELTNEKRKSYLWKNTLLF